MTDYASELASEFVGWYSYLTELSLLPQEYQFIIRVISGFFVSLLLLTHSPGLNSHSRETHPDHSRAHTDRAHRWTGHLRLCSLGVENHGC